MRVRVRRVDLQPQPAGRLLQFRRRGEVQLAVGLVESDDLRGPHFGHGRRLVPFGLPRVAVADDDPPARLEPRRTAFDQPALLFGLHVVQYVEQQERIGFGQLRRAQVGVDDYRAEVLPEDKAAFIRQEKEKGHTVIMVGDGVNDSPALSEADAGIAISTGAAIAREIADITVASEDLFALVTLRRLGEALMERIHGSYRFIVGFNLTLIALGVAGVLPPATSALLHNGSTLGISLRNMTDLLDDEENTQK